MNSKLFVRSFRLFSVYDFLLDLESFNRNSKDCYQEIDSYYNIVILYKQFK